MAEEKSIVEEAIIQMKNLEETVAQNAKGILASTMKQEIKELVKESLTESKRRKSKKVKEQEDDEEMDFKNTDVADVDFDSDEEDYEDDEEDYEDDEEDYEDDEVDYEDDEVDYEDDEEDYEEEEGEDEYSDDVTIDLRKEKDIDKVIKVYSLLDPNDEIEVHKDGNGNTVFKDNETDKEYLVVSEGMDDYELYEEDELEMDVMDKIRDEFSESDYDIESELEGDSDFYKQGDYGLSEEDDIIYELELDELDSDSELYEEDMDSELYEEDMDSELYEEDDDSQMYSDIGDMFEEDDMDSNLYESKKMKKGFKPKGMGFGNPTQSYKMSSTPNMDGGFKVISKKVNKTMGTGSAKKVKLYKDSPSFDGEFNKKPTSKRKEPKEGMVKKMETKEASRTLGNGKYWGREGLPKPKAAPRHLRKESVDNHELQILREKNEEYRKALNIFRNKLDEVAIFNSNLAYATRLFTEHSTSKQEKINILQRFDGVETLKESKNLYKVIKDELTSSKSQTVNESVERTIERTPSTGSAINLIESKTYENPQFLRMKDLMSKLK